MSAECGHCGSDIVYPPGTWPIGECPTCSRDDRIRLLTRLIVKCMSPDGFDRFLLNEELWNAGLGPQLGMTLCDPRDEPNYPEDEKRV